MRAMNLSRSIQKGEKPGAKIESPEGELNRFLTVSSSLQTLAARVRSLAGATRSSLGLRANRQPDKPVQRFGTQLAFNDGSVASGRHLGSDLLLDRLCLSSCDAAKPICLSPERHTRQVNSRTVSKNDSVSTPFGFRVNRNETFVSAFLSAICGGSTAHCPGFVQLAREAAGGRVRRAVIGADLF
jgi:hypothetical protein